MAIQQVVPLSITLVGDGVATTWTFALSKMFGVNSLFPLRDTATVPSSAFYHNETVSINGTASVDTFGNLTVTFASAPANGQVISPVIDLYFNSGNTAVSAPNTLSWAATTAPVVASQYSPVAQYTVPAGRTVTPVSFRSLSNTASTTSAELASSLVSLLSLATFVLNTNTFAAVNTVTQPRYMFSVFLQVTTAISAASTTITVTYTNQNGVTGRTGTCTLPASAIIGQRIQVALQAGDIGAIAVTNVSQAGSLTGAFTVWGANTIAYHVNNVAGQLFVDNFGVRQNYVAGDILSLEVFATSTVAVYRELEVTFLIQ